MASVVMAAPSSAGFEHSSRACGGKDPCIGHHPPHPKRAGGSSYVLRGTQETTVPHSDPLALLCPCALPGGSGRPPPLQDPIPSLESLRGPRRVSRTPGLPPCWWPTSCPAQWKCGSAFAHQAPGQSQWKEKHQAQAVWQGPSPQPPPCRAPWLRALQLCGRPPPILLSPERPRIQQCCQSPSATLCEQLSGSLLFAPP
jgi:hypothetical protein